MCQIRRGYGVLQCQGAGVIRATRLWHEVQRGHDGLTTPKLIIYKNRSSMRQALSPQDPTPTPTISALLQDTQIQDAQIQDARVQKPQIQEPRALAEDEFSVEWYETAQQYLPLFDHLALPQPQKLQLIAELLTVIEHTFDAYLEGAKGEAGLGETAGAARLSDTSR